MLMTTADYRRNVLKTLSQKPAKAGLRVLSSNQRQVNITHAIIGISTEVGELFKVTQDYITGAKGINDEMRKGAFDELGDILYYVFVLGKYTGVKMPSLTKKVALQGTMTSALVTLSILASDMLDTPKKAFYGPKTSRHPETDKQVPNKELQQAFYDERNVKVSAKLEEFTTLLWALIYAMLNELPQTVANANIAKLAARFPAGFFDQAAREDRDHAAEDEALESAKATAPAKKPAAKKPAVKKAAAKKPQAD